MVYIQFRKYIPFQRVIPSNIRFHSILFALFLIWIWNPLFLAHIVPRGYLHRSMFLNVIIDWSGQLPYVPLSYYGREKQYFFSYLLDFYSLPGYIYLLNKCLLDFLSPTNISSTKKNNAIPRKYINCSSYSSKTMELYFSSSILRMSSIIGFSPNSLFPARTYTPFPALAVCRFFDDDHFEVKICAPDYARSYKEYVYED